MIFKCTYYQSIWLLNYNICIENLHTQGHRYTHRYYVKFNELAIAVNDEWLPFFCSSTFLPLIFLIGNTLDPYFGYRPLSISYLIKSSINYLRVRVNLSSAQIGIRNVVSCLVSDGLSLNNSSSNDLMDIL